MTSGYFPGPYGSPFDDFFARYMGGARQPRQRVDITQFLSEQARELVNAAARRAAEVGSPDLDTDHLLWAMTEEEPTRQLISRAGADPAQLRAELDGAAASRRAARRDAGPHPRGQARAARRPPDLPGAGLHLHRSRAPADRAGGQPGLAGRADAAPARASRRRPCSRPPAARAAGRAAAGRPASSTPTLDEYGRDLTALARDGEIDPVIGREEEIEQTVEVLSRRTQEQPGAHRRGRRRQDRDRRGHRRSGSSRATCRRPCAASGWSSSTWPAWSPAPATAATSRSG